MKVDGMGRCRGAGLLLVGWLVAVAGAETLTYTLTPHPESGTLEVQLLWQTEGRSRSALCVSEKWGSVSNVAALLRDVRVVGATGGTRDGGCWLVQHRRGATLECTYRVDPRCRAFDWERTHLPITSEGFFHGIGNTFLLVPRPGDDGAPEVYDVLLRWKLPEGWKAVCSWGVGRNLGMPMSVHDLRQSVYVAGPLVQHTEKLEGGEDLTVALLGEFGFDAVAMWRLAAQVITAQCNLVGERQFPPYVVTVIPVGAPVTGGVSHLSGNGLYQSFTLALPPGGGLTEGVEHLLAHEMFHFWNGWKLRAAGPEGLVMWFTEGFTDYYALRSLYESGRWDAATLAKWVNRHLREYDANPARNATNEQIERSYWSKRDTVGEVPYQRGLLLAIRWHYLARQQGVAGGVDALMRSLLEMGRRESFRLSNGAIRSTGERVLGGWFAGEFEAYVERARTVDTPGAALGPALQGDVTTVFAFELGFDRVKSGEAKKVRGLVRGSAAEKAGLREGDELVGWRIPGDADSEVTIQVRREGEVKSIKYLPRGEASEVLQFELAEGASHKP